MKTTTSVLTFTRGSSIGFRAASARISLKLTQQELADIAGVSKDDVDFFEHNLPVPTETRRKLLRALWAGKLKSRPARKQI